MTQPANVAQIAASIEQIETEKLIPYAMNARTHNDANVAQIAASIREFGFTNPVLIDGENGIIAGHGRVLAARKLDMVTVPCIRLSYMTPAQKRAYVIADNKIALNSGWDEELLKVELATLRDEDFSLGVTGFSGEELAALLTAAEDLENIDSDGDEAKGASVEYLAVGKFKIPLDADEVQSITGLIEAYAQEAGTTFGFGAFMVRKMEGSK